MYIIYINSFRIKDDIRFIFCFKVYIMFKDVVL